MNKAFKDDCKIVKIDISEIVSDMSMFRTRFRLSPGIFVAGFALGFLACCVGGRWASQQAVFQNFRRFHYYIAPDGSFYPTYSEVCRLIEHACPANKIPVVIGGSSIMQGLGQSVSELWSDELQRRLGDPYVVINLGMRGGLPADFGWVAAQGIALRYRRIIYISDCPLSGLEHPEGSDLYDYFLWDAYYKGGLDLSAERRQFYGEIAAHPRRDPANRYVHLKERLDSWFYFNDLWTFVAYRYFSTFCTHVNGQFAGFWPRRIYEDTIQWEHEGKAEFTNDEISRAWKNLRRQAEALIEVDRNGHCREKADVLAGLEHDFRAAFPPDSKVKVFLVQVGRNPYFLRIASPDLQEAHRMAEQAWLNACLRAGISGFITGEDDFLREDFIDSNHLSGTGGKKLATIVARQIFETSASSR